MEQKLPQTETNEDPAEQERVRLAELVFNQAPHMANEYKALIKHTGGLVSTSMTYAYRKGIQDVIKLLLKPTDKDPTKNV